MATAIHKPPIDVLLINSNPDEVTLALRVLGGEARRRQVHVVQSGEEALQFLRRQGDFTQAPRPKLVLLDSRLPGISGLDVLQAMKEDTALRAIPVLYFTGDDDEAAAYDERARAVIAVPLDAAAFEDILHRLSDFWLGTAQLPVD